MVLIKTQNLLHKSESVEISLTHNFKQFCLFYTQSVQLNICKA